MNINSILTAAIGVVVLVILIIFALRLYEGAF